MLEQQQQQKIPLVWQKSLNRYRGLSNLYLKKHLIWHAILSHGRCKVGQKYNGIIWHLSYFLDGSCNVLFISFSSAISASFFVQAINKLPFAEIREETEITRNMPISCITCDLTLWYLAKVWDFLSNITFSAIVCILPLAYVCIWYTYSQLIKYAHS